MVRALRVIIACIGPVYTWGSHAQTLMLIVRPNGLKSCDGEPFGENVDHKTILRGKEFWDRMKALVCQTLRMKEGNAIATFQLSD